MENQEKQNTSQPHVQVFGEEIKSRQKNHDGNYKHEYKHRDCHCGCGCRHHHTGGIIFGLGVLFVGVLLLLNNAQIVPKEIWNYILPLWPILLILAGFRIILGSSWVSHFLISLLTLAAFCFVVLYGLIMVNSVLINYWHLPPELINFISQFK
jgi:hypothetical protein